jgi:hypothetical protein
MDPHDAAAAEGDPYELFTLNWDNLIRVLHKVQPPDVRRLLETSPRVSAYMMKTPQLWEFCIGAHMPGLRYILRSHLQAHLQALTPSLSDEDHAQVLRNLYFRYEEFYVWLKNRKPVIFHMDYRKDSLFGRQWRVVPPLVHRIDTDSNINQVRVEVNSEDNPGVFSLLNAPAGITLKTYLDHIAVRAIPLAPGQNCFVGGNGKYEIYYSTMFGNATFVEMESRQIVHRQCIRRGERGSSVPVKTLLTSVTTPLGDIPPALSVHQPEIPWLVRTMHTGQHGAFERKVNLLDHLATLTFYDSKQGDYYAAVVQAAEKAVKAETPPHSTPGGSIRPFSGMLARNCVHGGVELIESPPSLKLWCIVEIDYLAAYLRDLALLTRDARQGAEFARFLSTKVMEPQDPQLGDHTLPPLAYGEVIGVPPPQMSLIDVEKFWREQRDMRDCFFIFLELPARDRVGAPVFDLASIGIQGDPVAHLFNILMSDVKPIAPAYMHLTDHIAATGRPVQEDTKANGNGSQFDQPSCRYHFCPRPETEARHRCGRCGTHYCSAHCQKQDWPRHRPSCT